MSEEFSGAPILDDQPTQKDALDFAAYRDALVGIVRDRATQTPLVIGVFGTWGSGKTSLMRMVKARLERKAGQRKRWMRTMWFDAWKYHREEVVWRALLLQVLDCLGSGDVSTDDARKIADWKQRLYEDVEREELGEFTFELTKAGKGVLKLGLGLLPAVPVFKDLLSAWEAEPSTFVDDLVGAFGRQTTQIHERKVQFLEEFQSGLAGLLHDYVVSKGGLLVAFVDDLDRCLPQRALEVLEAIKLFLDVRGCVFILGLDREAIIEAVRERYPDQVKAEQYLEKIVQLPFLLPPIQQKDMADFVRKQVPRLPQRCQDAFTLGLKANPRQVKRTINVFLFLWKLSRQRLAEHIKSVRLAKVVVIQHSYPALYDLLVETPRYLRELEAHFRAEEARAVEQRGDLGVGDTAIRLEWDEESRAADTRPSPDEEIPVGRALAPSLQPFVALARLRQLLTMHPAEGPGSEEANFFALTEEELGTYISLTRRVAPEPAVRTDLGFAEPQMVRVPEAEFLMGSTPEQVASLAREYPAGKVWFEDEQPQQRILLPHYEIGKYPVTNTEYRAFVRDTSHQPPRTWEGDNYPDGLGDHPVVYVSWHDARAYSDWLREKTRRPYRLPTEAEWEKAARGTDGRTYPWGSKFDTANCSGGEGGIGRTTPVGRYSPHGDSPYAAADMAGNVWEWTSSLLAPYPYDADDGREDPEADGARVLRGGSFHDAHGYVRCAFRFSYVPDGRGNRVGFRVVVSPGSPS